MITEGMHPIPAGHVPAVVTYLDVAAPVITHPKPLPNGVSIRQERMDVDAYRALFRVVGAPWLWSSRLQMDDATLVEIITRKTTEIWVVRQGRDAIGIVELDFIAGDECELAYFGIVKNATGHGLGGPMMAHAQTQAFLQNIKRFFVHTCNWDDPRALAFYQKAGFKPYKYAVEVFPDPRLQGIHDISTAPHVPCIE